MNIVKMRNESNTDGLLDLIRELPDRIVMAEIGCYAGESTEMFLCSGKISMLYAIDPWQPGYDDKDISSSTDFDLVEALFDEKTKGKQNLTKLKMTMAEAFDLLPQLDVIYIDGNHLYDFALNDIELSLKKIKQGGIIAGHDFNCPDVKAAVTKIFKTPTMTFSDMSWMVKL